MHPAARRCSSVEYFRYSPSSRLDRRAPRPSRCFAALPPQAARSACHDFGSGRRGLDAGAQRRRRIEPAIEEVAGLDVAERLQHRALQAWMLALEIEQELLHALPLQPEIA